MTTKTLERILILRTMLSYGGGELPAKDIADRASTECDHDMLDALPTVSRRAIGQKLQAMHRDGLVAQARADSPRVSERVSLWSVTAKGRELAASLGDQPAPCPSCGASGSEPCVNAYGERASVAHWDRGKAGP